MKSVRTHTMVCVLKAPPASPQAARGVDVLCIDGPATIASRVTVRGSGFCSFPSTEVKEFCSISYRPALFEFPELTTEDAKSIVFRLTRE